MKLISCHISGFGNLENKDYTFDSPLTAICAGNGIGKTTLVTFIKAMFYGLDRFNQKQFTDRQHYCPLSGASYGGTLTFEKNKDIYRIVRTFSATSLSGDTCRLYKNDKLINVDKNTTVGEMFFGLKEESFSRVLFITSNDIEIADTGSIASKLNGFVEGNTKASVETAVSVLNKKAGEIKAPRSAKLLTEAKEQLTSIQTQINNLQNLESELPGKIKAFYGLKDQEKELEKRQNDAQRIKEQNALWDSYDQNINAANEALGAAQEISDKYRDAVPSPDECAAVNDAVVSVSSQATVAMSDEETERLGQLCKIFAEGLPSDEERKDIQDKISSYKTAELQIGVLKSNIPEDSGKFPFGVPSKSDMDKIGALCGKYEESNGKYINEPETIQSSAPAGKSSVKAYLIAAIISIIIALAGVGVIFANLIAGIVVLAVGVVCLVGTGFLYLNKKSSSSVSSVSVPNEMKSMYAAEREQIRSQIEEYFTNIGQNLGDDVSSSYRMLQDSVEGYVKEIEKRKETEEKISGNKQHMDTIAEELKDVYAKYGITCENLDDGLTNLDSLVSEYTNLLKTKNNYDENARLHNAALAQEHETLKAFCEKYNLSEDFVKEHISEISRDASAYKTNMESYSKSEKQAEDWKTSKNLSVRPEGSPDLTSLTNERNDLLNNIARLENIINDDQNKLMKLSVFKSDEVEQKNKIQEYEQQYYLYTKTVELLLKADDTLKSKYLTPVTESYKKHAAVFEEAIGANVKFDSKLNIKFTKNGREVDDGYLSTGQKAMCAFCFRLAIMDNIYGGDDKPFIILDDPFMSLDNTYLEKTLDIVKEMSLDFQLIYLTCHTSRQI